MASAVDRAALVALVRRSPEPVGRVLGAVESEGSPRAALQRELREVGTQLTLSADDPDGLIAEASADIAEWERAGLMLVTALDPGYPENLQLVHDRPPLLFVVGGLRVQDVRSVAIIGSRRASARGQETARTVACSMVDDGFTVVSGLAAGIDTAAHEATLQRSGRTIAVLGTGLCRSYPAQNAGLQARIAQRGAVVSQFWPSTEPSRETFPRRNAVMSGIALGTVIIEATPRSGSRLQARLALAHGRPVFLWHELGDQDWATDLARRPGVYVVDTAAQITHLLRRLSDPADPKE